MLPFDKEKTGGKMVHDYKYSREQDGIPEQGV
jgi:hypothetical protein